MLPLLISLLLGADAGVPVLTLEGRGLRAGPITQAELEALGPITADWKDKKGPHRVKGVKLDALLLARGFSEGASGPKIDPKLKHAGLRAALVATAADGFKAVFSIGELLETLGATRALLVWEVDGAPLPAESGPFRITVLTDVLPSRSLYRVVKLELVDLGSP